MRRVPAGVIAALALALALPASAGVEKTERAKPEPRRGGTLTTFTVRWLTDVESDNAGEQFRVYGPRGTRCQGLVVYTPTGYSGGTQTVRMGPRAKGKEGVRSFVVRPRDPDPEAGPEDELARWCRGVYRGRVDFDDEDGEVAWVVARFRFRVR